MMNTAHRKPLPGTSLQYFDAREAVDAIQPGAWARLPYTARVHAENLVRRADPAQLASYLRQLIERKREIGVDEPLTITTHAENLREHRKGLLVDMISEFTVGAEVVAVQTATFLKQQRTSLSDEPRGPAPKDSAPPPPDAVLSVDLRRIREYAAASGDRNPIHMGDLPAKAFGFSKAIAHGMWSAAAALANVEAQVPGEVTYDVQFGRPLLLPAKVNLYTRRVDGEGNFDLAIRNRRKGYPHLTATLRHN